jgi:hypothetical protein
MELIADNHVQAKEAWTSFGVTDTVQPEEPNGTKLHNFLTNIANCFTCLQFLFGMEHALRWSDFDSFARVFSDLATNHGLWPREAVVKRMRFPVEDNHGEFVKSMNGLIKKCIERAVTNEHWEDVIQRVEITLQQSLYTSLIRNRSTTIQNFILFVFCKSAAGREIPVSFVKLAHMVVRLCRHVEYLQLMYESNRSTDLVKFRGAAAEHQLPSHLGAFPWAANDGQTGLPLWAFYISGFNLYNEGLQVGFRAVQVPATGGCGYLTLIVLYMLSMREVLSVAPDGNGHAVSLPDDWEASCSDTLFCFSRLQCLTVLRVIADTNVVSHLNPSSMSDHSLKDQLGYFINKLELWDGADEVALWSAVNGEWMLDITDISMFLARCLALRVRMWRLCSAQPPDIAGSSEVIEYPNGIDLEPSLDEAGVCETFAPVFMHGTNSGHIVPAVRIGI